MSAPTLIHCFKCRKATTPENVSKEVTRFQSKVSKKDCARSTWVGVCSVCKKQVRQFAKSDQGTAPVASSSMLADD